MKTRRAEACTECGVPTTSYVEREINRMTRCGQGREDVPVYVALCEECQDEEEDDSDSDVTPDVFSVFEDPTDAYAEWVEEGFGWNRLEEDW